MLPDGKKVRELKGIFNFLSSLDTETNRLFSSEIRDILSSSRTLIEKTEAAAELRRKLELAKSRGFEVQDVLDERFTSFEQMVREITELVKQVEEIQKIITEYERIKRDVDSTNETIRQFEQILHQPQKHREIKSLWYKIKDEV